MFHGKETRNHSCFSRKAALINDKGSWLDVADLRVRHMNVRLWPWLVGVGRLLALAAAVLLVLAFLNVFDGWHHLDHLTGEANRGD
jgi:hypothetical protein